MGIGFAFGDYIWGVGVRVGSVDLEIERQTDRKINTNSQRNCMTINKINGAHIKIYLNILTNLTPHTHTHITHIHNKP